MLQDFQLFLSTKQLHPVSQSTGYGLLYSILITVAERDPTYNGVWIRI
jgi:hypothetical protein